MDQLQPDDPQTLGSYRLLSVLGAGGMGKVYLARSPGGRTVAVKVVRPELAADQDFRQRFRHEVEIARAVSGRYTAPVVDADPEAALPWLATAYVLGPDLTDVVAAHGALPERTVRALGAGLAAALQEIHGAGLIHRDLKPSNVLLAADGPRVIDFGIARAVDGSRMTQTGVVVGSPGYMPPEQALGQDVGVAGDIFSFGAVLAFAATGRGVFGEGMAPAAMLYQVVHAEPDLSGTPPMLTGLIRACLAKDPAARPSPAEIINSLAPEGTGQVISDWLPSSVSSTIATHASRILDLETPAGGNSPVPVPGQGFGPAPAAHTVLDGSGAAPTQAAAPGRRRFMGIAAGSVAGVAVVGAGAVWALNRKDGTTGDDAKDKTDNKKKKVSEQPEPEVFKTPPNGVAPQPLWHKTPGHDNLNFELPPLVFGSTVVISGDEMQGFDLTHGARKWKTKEIQPTSSAGKIVASGGMFFVGSGDYDGALVGIDAQTGKEAWRTRLGGKLTAKPPIGADDKQLYGIAEVDDPDIKKNLTAIYAVDIRTRKIVWQEQRDDGTEDYGFDLTVVPGHLVYTDGRKNLTVRSSATGKQLWSKKAADGSVAEKVAVHANTVIVSGKTMRGFDLRNGRPLWTLSPNGRRGFQPAFVFDGVAYAFDYDSGVWAVNPKNGTKIWMSEDLAKKPFSSCLVKVGGNIYAGSFFESGGVYAIDARTGALRWTYNDGRSDDDGWRVAAGGSRLLVAHANELYAVPAV
ncbi:protein kinase domain-containing protein [Streptomyces beijiangensis]|uniref:PQQ-binding-like beta-propeller repeat protein n=1 Tax=Streptomyces beijiangensis TaxID=163361 RepID=A0A939JI70_9ACTN|nr:serine/threonine-protein kinase [Streptomyces beijiangensis]MBO0512870.1 PQQ-binding-like beta-propeller repeat protein [Streptomyces beijiangensis]